VQEPSKAEHYLVLKGRLARVRPALCRLWRDGELRPGGVPSGVFVRLCLVADKPFLRHVCGLLSHNADAFGSPLCGCCDVDLYNFSMCKLTHYGQVSYERLCNRAHVALWQALGEPEPKEWKFSCDCCHEVSLPAKPMPCICSSQPPFLLHPQVFDSADGGLKKLEAEAAARLQNASAADDERFSKLHLSCQYGQEALIPFHYVQWDPMHGAHNELNVLLDEVRVVMSTNRCMCVYVHRYSP
jgi:hypothetical protein